MLLSNLNNIRSQETGETSDRPFGGDGHFAGCFLITRNSALHTIYREQISSGRYDLRNTAVDFFSNGDLDYEHTYKYFRFISKYISVFELLFYDFRWNQVTGIVDVIFEFAKHDYRARQ